MKINIIGAGHIGVINGACLSKLNHKIHFTDSDITKLGKFRERVPFFEEKDLDWDGLYNNTTISSTIDEQSDLFLICISIPVVDEQYDISQLLLLIDRLVHTDKPIILRSTLGFNELTQITQLTANYPALIWPEFLREGSALNDFETDDNYFASIGCENISSIVDELALPNKTVLVSDPFTLASVKMYSNAWRAIKLSFINSIKSSTGAPLINFSEFRQIFSALRGNCDELYLMPGDPFGGYCLPKELCAASNKLHAQLPHAPNMFKAAFDFNKFMVTQKANEILELAPDVVHFIGLEFKSGTSDIRNSPYLDLKNILVENGLIVNVLRSDEHICGHQNAVLVKRQFDSTLNVPKNVKVISF